MTTPAEIALSKQTGVPVEKIRFEKTLQNIQTGEKDSVVAEALLITVKIIFYHGFTAQRATDLKMKDVQSLPPDLQSDVRDYIQHLQALPNHSVDPDSLLFPCYQGGGEKQLERFLARNQCLNPESLRELGVKYNYGDLLKKKIESSKAVTETAKKFGEKEDKVKASVGWVDSHLLRKARNARIEK
jgi:hypothetical protein